MELMDIALKLHTIETLLGKEAADEVADEVLELLDERIDTIRSIGHHLTTRPGWVFSRGENSCGLSQAAQLGQWLIVVPGDDDGHSLDLNVVPVSRLAGWESD